jgi:hypothetical protein
MTPSEEVRDGIAGRFIDDEPKWNGVAGSAAGDRRIGGPYRGSGCFHRATGGCRTPRRLAERSRSAPRFRPSFSRLGLDHRDEVSPTDVHHLEEEPLVVIRRPFKEPAPARAEATVEERALAVLLVPPDPVKQLAEWRAKVAARLNATPSRRAPSKKKR